MARGPKYRGYIPPELTTGSEEQGYVEKIFRSVGGLVYRVTVLKGSGGTPGVSDDLIFLPNRKLLVAWDSKAGALWYKPGDERRLSEAQRTFGALMAGGYRTAFGYGDRETARRWLAELPGHSALEGLPLDTQGPIIGRKED